MSNKSIKCGNRTFIIEEEPIGNSKEIKGPMLVIWDDYPVNLDYTWKSGWEGHPENIVYDYAKVSELNGTNWYHTSVHELHKVIATDSRRLQKRYKLKNIDNVS